MESGRGSTLNVTQPEDSVDIFWPGPYDLPDFINDDAPMSIDLGHLQRFPGVKYLGDRHIGDYFVRNGRLIGFIIEVNWFFSGLRNQELTVAMIDVIGDWWICEDWPGPPEEVLAEVSPSNYLTYYPVGVTVSGGAQVIVTNSTNGGASKTFEWPVNPTDR